MCCTYQHAPSNSAYVVSDVVPLVYGETNVRKELIKVVQMGPFKRTVDDGLDARKVSSSIAVIPSPLLICGVLC